MLCAIKRGSLYIYFFFFIFWRGSGQFYAVNLLKILPLSFASSEEQVFSKNLTTSIHNYVSATPTARDNFVSNHLS
jgi:hypothetical protein